ncbi:MAG TPA: LPS export ABC transporter periplasmic protein LptC [Planktothrix sp.]|jgi:lipopolysaccharide export system protein LptC
MNRNSIIKLVVALSIPSGLAALFVYSQHQANVEVEEYNKFQKAHPAATNITVDNYELKEVDDSNQTRWQLVAQRGVMLRDSRDVQLEKVTMTYFDEGKVKMSLTAPTGLANETTKQVKLKADAKQRVKCTGEDGKAQLDADKVELKEKNKFEATGGVTILYPGVAKVSGATVIGSLEKSADLKNFTITGGTHAVIGKID